MFEHRLSLSVYMTSGVDGTRGIVARSTAMDDPYDLARFVTAQEGVYPVALAELRRGHKQSHWMWYVFPQIDGLGISAMARRYAIRSANEARAYLGHCVLGARLIEATEAMTAAAGSATSILGAVDTIKFRSSLTLFAAVADDPTPFIVALDRFYAGERDAETIARLR